jgi:hypothetical protein
LSPSGPNFTEQKTDYCCGGGFYLVQNLAFEIRSLNNEKAVAYSCQSSQNLEDRRKNHYFLKKIRERHQD